MSQHAKTPSAGSSSSQGQPRLLISLCLAIAGLLALCASPALAAQSHPYTGTSFGPDGVGGSASFERVQGIAVDPVSGDTYVYDGGAGKVYKFDATGAAVNFSATGTNAIEGVGGGAGGAEEEIALAPAGSPAGTAGDIYVANNSNALQIYASSGAKLGELDQGAETCGVATDPAGNLFAGVFSRTINQYTPSANPPSGPPTATGTADVSLCNVAADGLGNVYAARYYGGLFKLEGLADTTPAEIDPNAKTMAIAPGSNHVYADRGGEIVQYNSTGAVISSFGSGDIAGSQGIAVNSGATKIYAGTATKVKVFGPLATVPDATTEAADAITKGTALLHGTVGAAGGPATTCVFQYASNSAFNEHGFEGATEKPCAPAGPFTGTGTSAVSATPTGLSSETVYFFRVLATSSNGSNGGQALSFITPGAVNVQTGAATNRTSSSATLNGTVNPEGTELEECFFEYGPGETFSSTVPCAESPATIGSGNSPVAVHADLTGLTGGTSYLFRLGARNEFGTSIDEEAAFKTLGAKIEAESIAEVSESGASFKATINPNGEETTYRFEYVSEADFNVSGYANATQLPLGGQALGAGTSGVEVEQEIGGLPARATYHVRVIATNAGGTATGKDLVFTTYTLSAPGLPDGRAYEQVTDVKKNGAAPGGGPNLVSASPDGTRLTFYSTSVLPGADGAQQYPTFMSSKVSGGWTTQGTLPSATNGPQAFFLGWSRDLAQTYSLQAQYGESLSLYQRDSGGALTKISNDHMDGNTVYAGSSADNSIALFGTGSRFGSGADGPATFVWNKASGVTRPVGILNDGTTPAGGSSPGSPEIEAYAIDDHALSDDGSAALFSSLAPGQPFSPDQLYRRTNPTAPQSPLSAGECTVATDACTTRISAPEPGVADPNGEQPAFFWHATGDGSKVFFTSPGKLTADATTGPEDEGNDLYRFDASDGSLTDLAVDATDPAGAEVQGVVGSSEDGSHVYFVANGVLASGATSGDCEPGERVTATVGECNLYIWQNGTVTFIARLHASGQESPTSDVVNWTNASSTHTGNFEGRSSRVSADGRVVVFRSQQKLSDYDNQGQNEFYRYDADDPGQVQCVTCNPAGTAPTGAPRLQTIAPTTAPPATSPVLTRNLSTDGDRLFFDTPEPLVGRDRNGMRDVYEWEAEGAGSCHDDIQGGGCLYLISSGTSPERTLLADSSASGDDVFFFTEQPLVLQDRDQIADIYDARVGGGIPSQNTPPPVPCQTGEACGGSASQAGQNLTPGTAGFSGPPNSKPSRKHSKKKHHKAKHRGKKRHRGGKHNANKRTAQAHKRGGRR